MRKSNVDIVKSGRETQRETSEKKKIAQVPMQENKEMLQECFERICLMAMENERLFNKAGRSDEEVLEKKRELEIYKGRCDNLEKSRQFDSVNEERLIHLRHERDKLDASLRNANQEIDTLKNKIFEMDMSAANNQTLESDLRRAMREKLDFEEQVQTLTKENNSLYAELESFREHSKQESFSSHERTRILEDKLRLIENEREMMKDLLNRKEETDKRWREANSEIDCLKSSLFDREDSYANILREKEDFDRQNKFLSIDNDRLNSALSESDGKRSIAEESLRRYETSYSTAISDLDSERSANQSLNSRVMDLTDDCRK
jgi:chromosome segregation ATPase